MSTAAATAPATSPWGKRLGAIAVLGALLAALRFLRQPSERAIAAWSQSLNSAANGPEPCKTQPSALLLKTTVMIGMVV